MLKNMLNIKYYSKLSIVLRFTFGFMFLCVCLYVLLHGWTSIDNIFSWFSHSRKETQEEVQEGAHEAARYRNNSQGQAGVPLEDRRNTFANQILHHRGNRTTGEYCQILDWSEEGSSAAKGIYFFLSNKIRLN